MPQPFQFFYVFPCIEFLVTRDQHVTWRIGFVSSALCSNFINGLGVGTTSNSTLRRSLRASLLSSPAAFHTLRYPLPAAGISRVCPSSMERGVRPNSWWNFLDGCFLRFADLAAVNHHVKIARDAIDVDGTEGKLIEAHRCIPPRSRALVRREALKADQRCSTFLLPHVKSG